MRKLMGWLLVVVLLAACAPGVTELPPTVEPTVDPNGPGVSGPAGGTTPGAVEVTSTPGSADVDNPPAGRGDAAVIEFSRGGGLDGSFQAWQIFADGTISLADSPDGAALEVGQVTSEQVSGLVAGLDALGFFQLKDAYGENDNCADCFQYSVTVTNGGATKTVTTHDAASDAPAELQQMLALIDALVSTTI